VYVNQTNFNVKLSTKLGGQVGGQPKNWEGHGPPRPPLIIATEHDVLTNRLLTRLRNICVFARL